MKMKNWMRNAGFTLVELIVVIAVLGVLGAGAAVGYSGYVKKANKAADEALVAQVKYALELAAINGDITEGGGVALKIDAPPVIKDASGNVVNNLSENEVNAALEASFGAEYADTLQLSYDGWNTASTEGTFVSSAPGKLLGDIQALTNAMNKVFLKEGTTIAGGAFNNYLSQKGIVASEAPQKAANYATLFVAEQLSQEGSTADAARAEIVRLWKSNGFPADKLAGTGKITEIQKFLTAGTGLSNLGAMAVYYANMEAMVAYVNDEWTGDKSQLDGFNNAVANIATKFNNVSNTSTAWEAIGAGITDVLQEVQKVSGLSTKIGSYTSSPRCEKDAEAFLDTMQTIHSSGDLFDSNMDSTNLYADGTLETLLKTYVSLDGVGVGIIFDADGNYETYVYLDGVRK